MRGGYLLTYDEARRVAANICLSTGLTAPGQKLSAPETIQPCHEQPYESH
jgi:hypothetical protein